MSEKGIKNMQEVNARINLVLGVRVIVRIPVHTDFCRQYVLYTLLWTPICPCCSRRGLRCHPRPRFLTLISSKCRILELEQGKQKKSLEHCVVAESKKVY